MKGKKVNTDFLSEFIIECSLINKSSSEDIVNYAKDQLLTIDKKIKELEKLKITRSNLLDVVFMFDKNNKKTNNIDLSVFKIDNLEIAKIITDLMVVNQKIEICEFLKLQFESTEIIWCIKQLFSKSIVKKNNQFLLPGSNFNNFRKDVFHE